MVNSNPQIRLSIARNGGWGLCFARIEFLVLDLTLFSVAPNIGWGYSLQEQEFLVIDLNIPLEFSSIFAFLQFKMVSAPVLRSWALFNTREVKHGNSSDF